MRLIGILVGDEPWIAVETGGGAASVAPVDEFYADVPAHLAKARSMTSSDGKQY